MTCHRFLTSWQANLSPSAAINPTEARTMVPMAPINAMRGNVSISLGSAAWLIVSDTSIWIDHRGGHSPWMKKHGYFAKNCKNNEKDIHTRIWSKRKGSSSSSSTPIISDDLHFVIIAGCMVIVSLLPALYVRQLG